MARRPDTCLSQRSRWHTVIDLPGAAQQRDRLNRIETEAIKRIARHNDPWILVSLMPDLAGDLQISSQLLRDFREQTINREAWMVTPMGVGFRRVQVGHRRLLANGNMNESPQADWVSAEYHSDGAGSYGLRLIDLRERQRATSGLPASGEPVEKDELIDDVMIAAGLLTGLIRLARHARERAAAGGSATVRVQILPSLEGARIGIGHTRFHGLPDSSGHFVSPEDLQRGEASATVDDLADPGPELIRTAATLCDELGQVFGLAEQCQFTHEGEVRRLYWGGGSQQQVVTWAGRHGILVSEERLGD
jgi:hypothetical protein